jgi:hypothetical protein
MNRKIVIEFYVDGCKDEEADEQSEASAVEQEYNKLRDKMEKVFYVEKALFEISEIETHMPH